MSASSMCSLPCWPPCAQAIGNAGSRDTLGGGCQQGAGAKTRTQRLRTGSPSFGTGWEGRSYGKGVVKRLNVVAVATSPLEAAGVTESGAFSQSDEDLASRGLTVHSTLDDLDLDQLNSLFAKVSFPRREKQKLLKALQNTQSLLWIQEPKSKQLVAFARATGDRVYHAIIWDVVVDPSYQGLGLGKVLMERLMADLVKMGISNIALYAEPNVVGFYQPLGFVSDPDGIRAMAFSRRPR